MLNIFAKTALLSAIPKLVGSLHDLIFTRSHIQKKTKKKAIRKVVDTRPITVDQYDFIIAARNQARLSNVGKVGTDRKTLAELTIELNALLGLDKSITYYGDIWANRKKRESCTGANNINIFKE